ncbi:bifunctional precorrin-2 dehydrogenase/sirohydrochlorin ferrochelatase [uncultured Veillonella sp.]|uniref:precorrin-2 dehydrogenase/sirohydrochlorin ferrochelatase family protein n=1 Tax=uncultured Veillonella sp. TaxID=159268 RepID=UPI0025EC5BE5|nr:bifunctional precorrin-2 dehydrogenase/sirohydrochlorin ferrochelatase [uncultured Veillonella sp.]MDY3973653.1 bifunctional precorrin-2 dehydrogenase/sirohydrochlorin ferrochelatase [Veillonella caviae]
MVTMGFNMRNQPCVVVGGGKVAERRIRVLLEDQAQITIISPNVTATIQQWALEQRVVVYESKFTSAQEALLSKARFVIAATDDEVVNQLAASLGRKHKAFVNRVDNHEDCDFTFPATLVIGELVITIMTGRVSPRLNRLLKEHIEENYKQVADVLPKLKQYRQEVKAILPTAAEREAFWASQLGRHELDMILRGEWKRVEEQIGDAISSIRFKPSQCTR